MHTLTRKPILLCLSLLQILLIILYLITSLSLLFWVGVVSQPSMVMHLSCVLEMSMTF